MLNFISFGNNLTSPYRYNSNRANAVKDNFTCQKHSSLAPLAKDTVSFGTRRHRKEPIEKVGKAATLNQDLMKAFDNKKACEEVYKDAEFASGYLMRLLNNCFHHLLYDKRTNRKGPILGTCERTKGPKSIREKIAGALSKAITSEEPGKYAFNPNKKEEIKAHCNDLIGARIVLAKADKECSKQIIDALLPAIENGQLNITRIEHYVYRQKGIGSEQYFEYNDLKRLANAVNRQRALKGLGSIKVETKVKDSGYMALHLDVDLSNSDFTARNDKYRGEIQFIGYDVCQFKELEDLCYKINSGKEIKSGSSPYIPFSVYFKKQMQNPNYPNLEDDFTEYTKRAFLFQKRRKTNIEDYFRNDKKSQYKMPSIEDCQMEGRIPPGLDFRILNEIKKNCDDIYNIEHPGSENKVA